MQLEQNTSSIGSDMGEFFTSCSQFQASHDLTSESGAVSGLYALTKLGRLFSSFCRSLLSESLDVLYRCSFFFFSSSSSASSSRAILRRPCTIRSAPFNPDILMSNSSTLRTTTNRHPSSLLSQVSSNATTNSRNRPMTKPILRIGLSWLNSPAATRWSRAVKRAVPRSMTRLPLASASSMSVPRQINRVSLP